MHKILLSLVVLLLFGFSLKSQEPAQSVELYGEVFNDVGKPLTFAHIINISSHIGTLTNTDGRFIIHIYPEDTIKISSVGYKSKILLIPYLNEKKLHMTITLPRDTITLSEAIIYPYPATREALKKEFLTLELENEVPEVNLHLEKAMIAPKPQTGIVISGPISFLYNKFSRHGKNQKKYAALVHREQARISSTYIYNTALVRKITGMDSDKEVKKFMEFCDLEPEFILNSNEYDLFCAITDCFIEYSKVLK